MAVDPKHVESVFHAALDRPPGRERLGYLDAACDTPEFRQRVDRLLAAHDDIGAFLDGDPAGTTREYPSREAVGSVLVGRYKLLEQIGEGGMGLVFMAEQSEPVRRLVAVKVIKPGMDSQQVLARFESERQALALMDHPNIAKILDGGVTEAGRPFFVMELVKGMPITQFCDERKLSVRERLKLMVPVCQAVQHAHMKGIIHRDLKPGNVLVALYDGVPVPRVIDFGVSKAVGQRLTDRTLFTGFGTVVGTPEYMAPEQAEFNQLDIDTRADVYTLGILLYELITGTPPLDGERVKKAALLEVLRAVREEEPPKPSTRLSSPATPASVAANRRSEPDQLTKAVRGELDWIVMKALEKDRGRRYDTAGALADDLGRFLSAEPVLAHPPTFAYRMRKLIGRNKGAVAATLGVALTLVVGTAASVTLAVRAMEAERVAVAEGQRASDEAAKANAAAEESAKAREEEKAQKLAARTSAEGARAVEADAKAMLAFFDKAILGAPRPQQGGKDVTVRQALDQAEPEIAKAFAGRPHVEAAIRERYGETYRQMGDLVAARRQYELAHSLRVKALGPDDSATLRSGNQLAAVYRQLGQFGLARPLYEDNYKRTLALHGPDHADTLRAANGVAQMLHDLGEREKSLPLFEDTLARRRKLLGADHADTLVSLNNLALGYLAAGRDADAVKVYEEVVERRTATLGATNANTLLSQMSLAMACHRAGDSERAVALVKPVVAACAKAYGDDGPHTLRAQNILVVAYTRTDPPAAVTLGEQTLKLRKAKLPTDHPDTLTSQYNLAIAYRAAGQPAKAVPLLEDAAERTKKVFPENHPDRVQTLEWLALVYRETNQPDKAEAVEKQLPKKP
jgi:serine/threonine protein kinase